MPTASHPSFIAKTRQPSKNQEGVLESGGRGRRTSNRPAGGHATSQASVTADDRGGHRHPAGGGTEDGASRSIAGANEDITSAACVKINGPEDVVCEVGGGARKKNNSLCRQERHIP